MRYFILLMALVLSSCSHDDSQVNNGWVIYDLLPLEDGCIMYYGEDERISIFYNNRLIKFQRRKGKGSGFLLQEKMVTTIIPGHTIGVRLGIIVIYD